MIKPAVTNPADTARRLLLPVALLSLLALSGCGIKGPLELPTDAQVATGEGKGSGKISGAKQLSGYQPNAQQRKAAKQMGRPVKPDEPFFLDPLLK